MLLAALATLGSILLLCAINLRLSTSNGGSAFDETFALFLGFFLMSLSFFKLRKPSSANDSLTTSSLTSRSLFIATFFAFLVTPPPSDASFLQQLQQKRKVR